MYINAVMPCIFYFQTLSNVPSTSEAWVQGDVLEQAHLAFSLVISMLLLLEFWIYIISITQKDMMGNKTYIT